MSSASAFIQLDWQDWASLFGHFMLLSLLSVGGAITTTAEMHRYLVERQHWLTSQQFVESVALAQAAPGPNVLFVALMGWQLGLNTGRPEGPWIGMLVLMGGIMLPSATLAYAAGRWAQRNRERRSVRAFRQGLAPIVIGLLLATSWTLATAAGAASDPLPGALLVLATALVAWRLPRLHILWLLGAGAALGAAGLV